MHDFDLDFADLTIDSPTIPLDDTNEKSESKHVDANEEATPQDQREFVDPTMTVGELTAIVAKELAKRKGRYYPPHLVHLFSNEAKKFGKILKGKELVMDHSHHIVDCLDREDVLLNPSVSVTSGYSVSADAFEPTSPLSRSTHSIFADPHSANDSESCS